MNIFQCKIINKKVLKSSQSNQEGNDFVFLSLKKMWSIELQD